MHHQATLTSKGQFTIPKSIRRQLGLRTGMKMKVEMTDSGFAVRSTEPLKILSLQGSLKQFDDGRPTRELIAIARDRAMRSKFSRHQPRQ